jgi:hypothetical protein
MGWMTNKSKEFIPKDSSFCCITTGIYFTIPNAAITTNMGINSHEK